MQHTNKYNLNIIETTDAFSPEPLNENIRALETLLDAKAAQTDFAALAGRVGTLETGRLCWKFGTYPGTGGYGTNSRNRMEFDFRPIAIFVYHPSSPTYGGHLWLRGTYLGISCDTGYTSYVVNISWGNRTVEWFETTNAEYQLNRAGVNYPYLVLGTEE